MAISSSWFSHGFTGPYGLTHRQSSGVATVSVAMLVALCGAAFFAAQQRNIVRGFVRAGTWINWVVFALVIMVRASITGGNP